MNTDRPRYRRWRDDLFGHPKTAGMRPTSYALMQMAVAQNLLGVLQRSPRALAQQFGGVPVRVIQEAIDELELRGIAKWWPDLEILCVIETLDEQSTGAKVDVAASKQAATFPTEVRQLLLTRYGDRLSRVGGDTSSPPRLDTVSRANGHTLPDTHNSQEQDQDQEAGSENRKQDQDQDSASTTTRAARSRSKTPTQPDIRAIPVLAKIDELRQLHGLKPLPPSQRLDRHIVARLDDGEPVEDLLLALELRSAEAERDTTGRQASYLDASAPFTGPGTRGPGGWAMSRRMLDQHRARPRSRPAVIADHDVPDWAREPRT